jgi:hypothetical protein
MLQVWWFLPAFSAVRVGEQRAVVWKRLYFSPPLAKTLWLRSDLRERVGGAARLIEKGVVCWLHRNRGLLRGKPIRMFEEGREVPTGRTK